MNRYMILLLVVVSVYFLQGCGGSSGGSNGFSAPINNSPSSSSAVTIAKSALQFGETTTVTASFIKSTGLPAAGVAVNFTTTLGTLTPINGNATTDVNGNATIQLTAGTTSGQGQVTVSANVDNTLITKNSLFSVSLPQLNLSNMTLGLSTLSYGGSTSVSVTVRDSNNNIFTTQDVDVVFTSAQAASGKATISTPVKTINGVASSTYSAITASGTDTITASISGSSVTATLNISPLSAGSISYISANPKSIALKGMGGLGYQETSSVTFKVLNSAGQPAANQQMDFALNTTVGGLTFSGANPLTPGILSGSTSADGTVSVIVQAGTVATPVRVTATVRGSSPAVVSQSDQLVVSTGIPSQDGLSISLSNLNPESLNTDGVSVTVTARLSDHFLNPVLDGTAVSFTASGGSITPSCTTLNGTCSVTWTSQNPRPTVSRGAKQDGRAVILAYAVGEESFLDLNGNGLADPTDTWRDDGEAFRDDNEDDVRQLTETFIDFNNDGVFNLGDGLYNGVLQGTAYVGAPRTKHVFSNSVLVMSGSGAFITNSCGSTIHISGNSLGSCGITVKDVNGNTMPSGTKVEFTIKTFAPQDAAYEIVAGSSGYIIPQNISSTGTLHPVSISNLGTTLATAGVLTVKVSSPAGLITETAYPIVSP